ncbi:glycosyltransferase family 4 protein [Algibacter amylolyticus]|uniref:Glycosyltransferase family 4 protein n=1 Tax=Algibacter amylolyticus TaxID=1608400 RepID=A0A5M7B7A8_9FLAO|nr:glycosyltransferase family 4 protein [Algibacter amylolyticus]KAA5823534.1 glycosyltransferase family 4 protein [Algibacter amylolyticus]MBB5267688.1 glycosyltransferase involved in cell wall biosynthesis [Algibacter amylolyticus]TSJ74022.1 glycosyltransferase family 4 protein [Algibacter amylolyticus]
MKKNLLIIGYVWPEPKSSAAGSRMMQLIDVFQSENYIITFASPCAKSDNAFNLNSIGVTQVSIALNNTSFDDFIKDLNPNVVLFDRFMMEEQFGWRVTEHCPNALKILDTEDLHCLRKGRHQAYKDNKPFNKTYLFSDTAKREIASIYRCDITLIISQAEMDILKNDFKMDEALLLYLPFMLEQVSNHDINAFPKFEARAHFISIGNFLHEPNYNAVLYLKETIWPLIRKELPQAELHIYGAYVSQKVTQLNNKKQGFIIKGFAPDVNTVMENAKVCLAPIRFGAGLKGKIVDAMQKGTPMVTTTVGAEGMFGDFEPNGFIEDDANCFANKAIQLYNNEWFWTEKQTNGFSVINNRFNAQKHKIMFVSRIESIINNLDIHRQHNFMGQMLHHHSMQSTKFMSRWIEEKNKA